MNRQTTPKRARGTSRRSSKRGLAPGSVVFIGAAREQAAGISLIEYGTDALRETRFTSLEQSRQHEATLPMRWLNVYGVHDTRVLAEIGQRFGLHPLVLEDIANTEQRPKVEDYGDQLFIVARVLQLSDDGHTLSPIPQFMPWLLKVKAQTLPEKIARAHDELHAACGDELNGLVVDKGAAKARSALSGQAAGPAEPNPVDALPPETQLQLIAREAVRRSAGAGAAALLAEAARFDEDQARAALAPVVTVGGSVGPVRSTFDGATLRSGRSRSSGERSRRAMRSA